MMEELSGQMTQWQQAGSGGEGLEGGGQQISGQPVPANEKSGSQRHIRADPKPCREDGQSGGVGDGLAAGPDEVTSGPCDTKRPMPQLMTTRPGCMAQRQDIKAEEGAEPVVNQIEKMVAGPKAPVMPVAGPKAHLEPEMPLKVMDVVLLQREKGSAAAAPRSRTNDSDMLTAGRVITEKMPDVDSKLDDEAKSQQDGVPFPHEQQDKQAEEPAGQPGQEPGIEKFNVVQMAVTEIEKGPAGQMVEGSEAPMLGLGDRQEIPAEATLEWPADGEACASIPPVSKLGQEWDVLPMEIWLKVIEFSPVPEMNHVIYFKVAEENQQIYFPRWFWDFIGSCQACGRKVEHWDDAFRKNPGQVEWSDACSNGCVWWTQMQNLVRDEGAQRRWWEYLVECERKELVQKRRVFPKTRVVLQECVATGVRVKDRTPRLVTGVQRTPNSHPAALVTGRGSGECPAPRRKPGQGGWKERS